MRKNVFHWILTIAVICCTSMLTSCSNKDEPVEPQAYAGVPLIILDTDIGSSTVTSLPWRCSITTRTRGVAACSA